MQGKNEPTIDKLLMKNTTTFDETIVQITIFGTIAICIAGACFGLLLISIIVQCLKAMKNNVTSRDGFILRQLVFLS